MRSYVCTRDIHKRVMFANYIFANITSFAKFAKILSRENFQVYGIEEDRLFKHINLHACPVSDIYIYIHIYAII